MRAVLVEWEDSSGTNGWMHASDAAEQTPLRVWTLGWLLSEGRDGIRVALSHDEREQVADTMTIPLTAVVQLADVTLP